MAAYRTYRQGIVRQSTQSFEGTEAITIKFVPAQGSDCLVEFLLDGRRRKHRVCATIKGNTKGSEKNGKREREMEIELDTIKQICRDKRGRWRETETETEIEAGGGVVSGAQRGEEEEEEGHLKQENSGRTSGVSSGAAFGPPNTSATSSGGAVPVRLTVHTAIEGGTQTCQANTGCSRRKGHHE